MAKPSYTYIIIGAGLSGSSAAEGIRLLDPKGSILLLGAEKEMPYDRPPLSKQLWKDAKPGDAPFLHDEQFYKTAAVDLRLGVTVTGIDAASHTIRDSEGNVYRYERLLLATGGTPRRLD